MVLRTNHEINSYVKASKYSISGTEILSYKDKELEINQIALFVIEARHMPINKAGQFNINLAKESPNAYQAFLSRSKTLNDLMKELCLKLRLNRSKVRLYINRVLCDSKLYELTLTELILNGSLLINDVVCIEQQTKDGIWEFGINDSNQITRISRSNNIIGFNNIGNSMITY